MILDQGVPDNAKLWHNAQVVPSYGRRQPEVTEM
jgi:hypothetical protein